jgi:hypothetical protein
MPSRWYGKTIAINAVIPTWNPQASATHTVRSRPPARATGAASSTATVSTARGTNTQA